MMVVVFLSLDNITLGLTGLKGWRKSMKIVILPGVVWWWVGGSGFFTLSNTTLGQTVLNNGRKSMKIVILPGVVWWWVCGGGGLVVVVGFFYP